MSASKFSCALTALLIAQTRGGRNAMEIMAFVMTAKMTSHSVSAASAPNVLTRTMAIAASRTGWGTAAAVCVPGQVTLAVQSPGDAVDGIPPTMTGSAEFQRNSVIPYCKSEIGSITCFLASQGAQWAMSGSERSPLSLVRTDYSLQTEYRSYNIL